MAGRLASFRYALRGAVELLRSEPNARLHLVATVVVLGFGFVLRLTADEWRWIVLAIGLVWIVEAANTAIERTADAITLERHPMIGAAKDVSAFAVLATAVTSAIIGLSVFGPHLW